MRPSSVGGGRNMRRTLSVCLSVRPVRGCTLFTFAPSYERTSKIEKLQFSLMGQRHVCTFRHAQRAAYRTAISAAQILVKFESQLLEQYNVFWYLAVYCLSTITLFMPPPGLYFHVTHFQRHHLAIAVKDDGATAITYSLRIISR